MKISPQQLDIIRKIFSSISEDCKVLAFGSRVSGNAAKFSDLDLAIVGNKEIPLSVISELKDAFSESDLPFRVDLIDWSRTSEKFRTIVLERSEQIFPG